MHVMVLEQRRRTTYIPTALEGLLHYCLNTHALCANFLCLMIAWSIKMYPKTRILFSLDVKAAQNIFKHNKVIGHIAARGCTTACSPSGPINFSSLSKYKLFYHFRGFSFVIMIYLTEL